MSSSGLTSSITRDIAMTTFFGFLALAAAAEALAAAAAAPSSESSPKRSRSSSSAFLAGVTAVVGALSLGGPPACGLSDFWHA